MREYRSKAKVGDRHVKAAIGFCLAVSLVGAGIVLWFLELQRVAPVPAIIVDVLAGDEPVNYRGLKLHVMTRASLLGDGECLERVLVATQGASKFEVQLISAMECDMYAERVASDGTVQFSKILCGVVPGQRLTLRLESESRGPVDLVVDGIEHWKYYEPIKCFCMLNAPTYKEIELARKSVRTFVVPPLPGEVFIVSITGDGGTVCAHTNSFAWAPGPMPLKTRVGNPGHYRLRLRSEQGNSMPGVRVSLIGYVPRLSYGPRDRDSRKVSRLLKEIGVSGSDGNLALVSATEESGVIIRDLYFSGPGCADSVLYRQDFYDFMSEPQSIASRSGEVTLVLPTSHTVAWRVAMQDGQTVSGLKIGYQREVMDLGRQRPEPAGRLEFLKTDSSGSFEMSGLIASSSISLSCFPNAEQVGVLATRPEFEGGPGYGCSPEVPLIVRHKITESRLNAVTVICPPRSSLCRVVNGQDLAKRTYEVIQIGGLGESSRFVTTRNGEFIAFDYGEDPLYLIVGDSEFAFAAGRGGQEGNVRLVQLRPMTRVSGQVVSDSGKPIDGAEVRMWTLPASSPDALITFNQERVKMVTGQDGTFAFDYVPLGRARWSVRAWKYGLGQSQEIWISDKSVTDARLVIVE